MSKKYLLALVLLVILFFASEFGYILFHHKEKFAPLFLRFAKLEMQSQKLDTAMENIDQAATYYILDNKNFFGIKIPDEVVNNNLNSYNENTRSQFLKYLTDQLPYVNGSDSIYIVSDIYYNLGLIAYSNGYHDDANKLFRTAVLLHPELSFLFIELSNSYSLDGNFKRGRDFLDYCLQFAPAHDSCLMYIEKSFKTWSFEPVGYYKEQISKYRGIIEH